MYRRLGRIYENIGVATLDDDSKNVWKETLDQLLSDIVSHSSSTKKNSSKIVPIMHKLLDEKRAAAAERLSAMDHELGLLLEAKDADEHDRYLKAINALHGNIARLLKKAFPDSQLSIYGSCLSDLSLGKASDVDLSLHIDLVQKRKDAFQKGNVPVAQYEREMKSTVYKACRKLECRTNEFRHMQPITRARVPVVRGTYVQARNPYTDDGSMDFDICFLNDIAVANSSLLREYSLVDLRVKQLMIAVKRWAKHEGVCSAKDYTYSSYTWMVLVIFFLQNIDFVPNLQSSKLMEAAGVQKKKHDRWNNINNLDTFYAKWNEVSQFWKQPEELASTSVTELLYKFFHFYAAEFPSHVYLISIKQAKEEQLPKSVFRKCSFNFVIEDPFETYDSHCPHDLGGHANEPGFKMIKQCIQDAEMFLRKNLEGVLDSEVPAKVPGPWPHTKPVNKHPKKHEQKKGNEAKNSHRPKSPVKKTKEQDKSAARKHQPKKKPHDSHQNSRAHQTAKPQDHSKSVPHKKDKEQDPKKGHAANGLENKKGKPKAKARQKTPEKRLHEDVDAQMNLHTTADEHVSSNPSAQEREGRNGLARPMRKGSTRGIRSSRRIVVKGSERMADKEKATAAEEAGACEHKKAAEEGGSSEPKPAGKTMHRGSVRGDRSRRASVKDNESQNAAAKVSAELADEVATNRNEGTGALEGSARGDNFEREVKSEGDGSSGLKPTGKTMRRGSARGSRSRRVSVKDSENQDAATKASAELADEVAASRNEGYSALDANGRGGNLEREAYTEDGGSSELKPTRKTTRKGSVRGARSRRTLSKDTSVRLDHSQRNGEQEPVEVQPSEVQQDTGTIQEKPKPIRRESSRGRRNLGRGVSRRHSSNLQPRTKLLGDGAACAIEEEVAKAKPSWAPAFASTDAV